MTFLDRSRQAVQTRDARIYHLVVDTDISLKALARAEGYANHTGAIAAALRHARRIGVAAARVSDLRAGKRAGRIDWTKFALAIAGWREREGLTQAQAARRAGFHSRTPIHRAERANALDTASFLLLARAAGLTPFDYLPVGAGPDGSVPHETPVKHGAGDIRDLAIETRFHRCPL